MTSVQELDLPMGWEPASRSRTYALVALTAPFSLIVLTVSALGLTGPTVEGRLFASAFFLVGIGFAGGTWAIWRRGRPGSGVRGVELAKTDDGTPVLRIRRPRILQVTTTFIVLCFGAGAVVIGAGPLITGGTPAVVFLLCGAYFVVMPLVMLAWGVPEIRLDERGVLARGGGRRSTVAWDDVVGLYGIETRHERRLVIAALDVKWQAERFYWTTPARRRRNAEQIEIVTEQFGVAPVLLYHLLRFYHENPAARAELGRREALRRLHDARFPA
ncbi:hypothetical protein K1T35_33650 [Pseudonocardia sp. DSM 110487]|uniref:hypothetical protein n=1 Tax=Pseudonocardia sp. DSM 110487 TaxID=2865833 RepID=UPI001C6A8732|nr:hypothetical protein [Pseudonocardia sp. DSM 110487]QYN33416.1 hypothetical protein K1T35_33650 [Pseudonocardia sp. DSM 110487]